MIHLRSTLGELDEALAAGIWALEFAARLGDLKLPIQTTSYLARVYSHRAERDPKVTVRRMLYAASGDVPRGAGNAWETAANVGMVDRKAGFLSGGERQMLMIGRAILGRPKLLLVDEPTEGLAPSIVTHLKDVFRGLSKKTALVIVEQNLPLVCAIADRVYALNGGRIMTELADRASIRPEICERYL